MEIASVDSFLPYFENIRRRTTRVIGCIPSAEIEWTYRTDKFTFGDLIRHIAASERYMFAENVRGNQSRYPGHTRELADGYDQVVGYLDACHSESMEIFRGLSDEGLQNKCTTPGGVPLTTWKWLRAMVEHEIHHRGQIYMMLGMLDAKTPPLYGLTSEEVKERSVSK